LGNALKTRARTLIAMGCITVLLAVSTGAFAQRLSVGGKDFTEQLLWQK
jgi:hypothetical protein